MGTRMRPVMPKKLSLQPVRTASPDRNRDWKVDVPASVSQTGKRQRFFFKTKALADGFSESERIRLINFGLEGGNALTPSESEQSANALLLLEPYGVTLNEVVTDWINRKKCAEASISYEAGMDEFFKWRKRSPSYERSIEQTKNRLTALHGKLLNQISSGDVARSMDGMKASVRNFTIRILGGLFNFGIKRGYCIDNPVRKVDLAQRENKEIEIYSVREAAKILHAAERHSPSLVPFLAASFFTGLRRSEALRVEWSAFDFTEHFLKLPAAITKTKRGRHIEMSPNCRAWLSPYKKKTGKIFPFSGNVLRNRLEELREVHGVKTIKHGARHSFASYWLAQNGDINQLCRFLGHDDPETTFRHYARAATKREATKFFTIVSKKPRKIERKRSITNPPTGKRMSRPSPFRARKVSRTISPSATQEQA